MAWDLTNEGLNFTPQQVSLQALLSGRAPQKNQKFFRNKGEAMAEANSLLQNTQQEPTFAVSPTTAEGATPGTPAIAAPQPGAAGPTGLEPQDEAPPNVAFSGGVPYSPDDGPSAQTSALPKFLKPTYGDVQNDPITSPRTTKLGVFLNLLKSAASGAAAGESSIIQTPRGAVSNPGAG